MIIEASQPGVVAGIDAAVVAAHHVAIRDGDRWVRFKIQPTLARIVHHRRGEQSGSTVMRDGMTSWPRRAWRDRQAGLAHVVHGAVGQRTERRTARLWTLCHGQLPGRAELGDR